MSITNRFSATIQGSLIMTGNTLGLAGYGGNLFGNANLTVATPPPPSGGLTTSYLQSSSSGFLNFPIDSVVVYAELIWVGTSKTDNTENPPGNFDITANENDNINIIGPSGTIYSVSRDVTGSQAVNSGISSVQRLYTNIQDVTSIVLTEGSGKYTIAQVPTVIGINNTSSGWQLIVAYKNNLETYKNLYIWTCFEDVGPSSVPSITIPVSGFATPPVGPLSGRLIVSAAGGNPNLTGDFIKFGETSGSAVVISGPNNLADNFFASQINNNSGNLDTTGTFGTANSTPNFLPTFGNRNSFDITNIDVSNEIVNNQTDAVIIITTSGDAYQLSSIGLQIGVNAPLFSPVTKIVDKAFANIGDSLTYTVTFTNTGTAFANDLIFVDTVPKGTIFNIGSLSINGSLTTTTPLSPGILIGDIGPGVSTTISFKVNINTIPSPNPIANSAEIGFNFSPGIGISPISANENSNTARTRVNTVNLNSSKSANKKYATVGDKLTYKISLFNTGTTTISNLLFIDTIPSNTSFEDGSLSINGTTNSGNPNPPGVVFTNIPVGTSTISFNVTVTTLPTPNIILNNSTMSYNYVVDPTLSIIASGNSSTNEVETIINTATFENSFKYVSKEVADCGDVITYTIVLVNSGNTTSFNVVFSDTTPNGMTFITGSIKVNNISVTGTPSNISIGTMTAGSTQTITFSMKITC